MKSKIVCAICSLVLASVLVSPVRADDSASANDWEMGSGPNAQLVPVSARANTEVQNNDSCSQVDFQSIVCGQDQPIIDQLNQAFEHTVVALTAAQAQVCQQIRPLQAIVTPAVNGLSRPDLRTCFYNTIAAPLQPMCSSSNNAVNFAMVYTNFKNLRKKIIDQCGGPTLLEHMQDR